MGFGHDARQALHRRPLVPLVREGIAYFYEPRPSPAGDALMIWCLLLLLCRAGKVLEEGRFKLDQGGSVFLGHHTDRGIHFQVLALSFENHSAFFEVVVQLEGVHRMISSRSRDR